MEFVIVSYPTRRPVYVDGDLTGYTNEVLQMDAGTHKFTLGPPEDCDPLFCEVMVKGTNVLLPMKIAFIKKWQG